MTRGLAFAAAGAFLAAGSMAYATGGDPSPAAPAANAPAPRRLEDSRTVYRVPVDGSAVRGPADALVTIVEVADFECPFCKRVVPTLRELARAYPGQLRFAFKHGPLWRFHPYALSAAMAAEEARAQGGDAQFWAMHDKLFELSPALDAAGLERAGAELGLDGARLTEAVAARWHQARIDRDLALVAAVRANATPTFFVNGKKLEGALPLEVFKAAVEDALARAKALVAAGTPARQVYEKIIADGAAGPVLIDAPPPATARPTGPPRADGSWVDVRPDDPSRGPASAKLTVAVFADFQCPFSARLAPALAQLAKLHPRDLRVVWKHHPLPMHPNALPAALAAEAARAQGRFWEMHDLLFSDAAALSPAVFEQHASELGLDLGRFRAATFDPRTRARVADDERLAESAGATGTPTLFFNCRKIEGAVPLETLEATVREELAKADALLGGGARRGDDLYRKACATNLGSSPAGPGAPTKEAPPAPPPVPRQDGASEQLRAAQVPTSGTPRVSAAAAVAVRDAWEKLPRSEDGCRGPYDAFPAGGILSFYCHAKTLLSLAELQRLAGVPIFASGPHGAEPALGIADDFGHYDPRFVRWLRAALLPARSDATFRARTQPVYDAYVAHAARVWYGTRRRLEAHRAWFEKDVAWVRASLARQALPDDYLSRYYELMAPSFFGGPGAEVLDSGDWDGEVVKSAVGFWIRRELDGTAAEFAAALDELVGIYAPVLRMLGGTMIELRGSRESVDEAAIRLSDAGARLVRGPADRDRSARKRVSFAPGYGSEAKAVAAQLGIPASAVQPLATKASGDVLVSLPGPR